MQLFRIEHSTWAYRADFGVYMVASAGMAMLLLFASPSRQWPLLVALAAAGLLSWTFVEYFLHRIVLHGIRPFSTWHETHHQRPVALISTPTLLSAFLLSVLVFWPAILVGGLFKGGSFGCGLLIGYLLYTVTHHATHHWHSRNGWLKARQRAHALHHSARFAPANFGVTSLFWDRVFGSLVVRASRD
jgi:sterol desaturase/sphingolipid hydroxylase (fatty acid hydroxylase superfamily)